MPNPFIREIYFFFFSVFQIYLLSVKPHHFYYKQLNLFVWITTVSPVYVVFSLPGLSITSIDFSEQSRYSEPLNKSVHVSPLHKTLPCLPCHFPQSKSHSHLNNLTLLSDLIYESSQLYLCSGHSGLTTTFFEHMRFVPVLRLHAWLSSLYIHKDKALTTFKFCSMKLPMTILLHNEIYPSNMLYLILYFYFFPGYLSSYILFNLLYCTFLSIVFPC